MECILYRAITPREYNDIKSQGDRFRCIERSLEAKQFALTEECGHYYGKEIVMQFDRVNYILIQVVLNIQKFCADKIKLDDCTAVSIDKSNLNDFNNAIQSLTVV
jgi:hypothetical protein